MVFDKLLPRRFSTRLFLMTFIAGLIPIVVFTILIDTYGKRIENDMNRIIEEGYKNDMVRSAAMLREIGEASVYSHVMEMSQQLDLIIESVPWMTLPDLRRDEKFRELAIQSISRTGHTYLFEADTGIVRFHRDRRLENRELRRLFRNLPSFQAIVHESLKGPRASRGYYRVDAGDGNILERYLCIVPLHNLTADGTRLMLAASVDADDFSWRIKESQEIHEATKNFLTLASQKSTRSLRETGLMFMGIGIITISLLAFFLGMFSSRGVKRLREATARINEGDLSTPVKVTGSGEMATLMKDFNRMLDQLATTTVSKQLLQASEARLKVANNDLRKEIVERERTETALAAEKERLNITLRSIGEGVISADSDGKVVLINNVAEKLTGWKQEDALGVDLSLVFSTVSEGSYYIPNNGEPPRNEGMRFQSLNRKVITSRAGVERMIVETSSPIWDKGGSALGTVVVFRDITDQKKVEEELLKARKLESIGVLAGGIAHDFNNLLAVILGNISFGKMFIRPEDKAFGRLVEAENACMRGKDLTYQLLAFARGGEPLRTTTDVGRLVQRTVETSLADSGVTCDFSLPDGLSPLRIDEKQICQVIERMVRNAVEAMEGEGKLQAGAENITIWQGNPIPLKPGEYVKISIRDQGAGIPEEDLQRIFDPYFTKKQMGYQKGTGLGLSVSYSVIKDHGGLITVESGAGKGTCFNIFLPADHREEEGPMDELAVTAAGAVGGRGRLLFMDDDAGVRDVIVEILIHLGYDVHFAWDGSQALEQYKEAAKRGEPFDVVIADLVVRDGMGGKDLIRQLHEMDPDVRAVVSSGYSTDPVLSDFKRYGFLGVVAKPYRIEELCAVVDAVMQGGRTGEAESAETTT